MSHIARIDSKDTHGWQFRGRDHTKFFSDSKYGGKERARRIAETYLYDHGDGLDEAERPPFFKGNILSKRNSSGTRGVYRSHEFTRGKNKYKRYYWAATYTIGAAGQKCRGSKKFYIDNLGEFGAKAAAIEFRQGWEAAYDKDGVAGVQAFFEEFEVEPGFPW